MSQQCEACRKILDLVELPCPEKGSPRYLVLFVPGEIRQNSKWKDYGPGLNNPVGG